MNKLKANHVLLPVILVNLIVCLFVLYKLEEFNSFKLSIEDIISSEKLRDTRLDINKSLRNQRQPKILCWILSFNSTKSNKKSEAVRRTWAKRCDKYLIVTNGTELHEDHHGNTLRLPIDCESRHELWRKVAMTFIHLYDNYLEQFDWFMKADDDTYVLVDSLRIFLNYKSNSRNRSIELSDYPIYYGHKFKPYVKQGYMSGGRYEGSDYVLSREALRRLVERGFEQEIVQCRISNGEIEDLEMGKCLEAVGVEAGDSRDPRGKETFLPLSPEFMLSEKMHTNFWYFQYDYYKTIGETRNNSILLGKGCCSKEPISFHYIQPNLMYLIDWLLYDVKKPETIR